MNEVVVVKRVPNEIEAELVCGLLRSAGIECGYRVTEEIDSASTTSATPGRTRSIVHPPTSRPRASCSSDAPADGDDSWDDDELLPRSAGRSCARRQAPRARTACV